MSATKGCHQGPTNSSTPMRLAYAELVEEHRGALVWVGHLDAGHDASRCAVVVKRDQQVMTRLGEKALGAVRSRMGGVPSSAGWCSGPGRWLSPGG
jgi:hypothetical protein